ncbi:olfactory receptor-like protein DTMT [Erpetoichthys calabaricus]|uniref:olfactory receptor-like protein DTMT n=1 Tax=Erpetoichthys calabaricus TaxID=27687 RepID=UPI00223477B6|nr:olfactory receptor-like protein DTMT [Erpetoichthys calabaricus]
MLNITVAVSEFLLDCAIIPGQRSLTVAALILVYVVSIIGNVLVIIVVKINQQLHSPMYIFIGTLAIIDLANSTIIIPKMLAIIQFDYTVISYEACLAQMFGIINLEQIVALLLALMAVDRYIAVVYPLRYPSIVTRNLVVVVISVLPVFSIVLHISYLVYTTELSFCHTNVLPYCLCDYATLVHASCNEDPKYLSLLSIMVMVLGICPLLLILLSYFRIVIEALKIKSKDRNNKVFSTCVTHIIVVCFFYLPPLTSYILPGAGLEVSSAGYNAVFISGNVVPPMMNPVIYSFRNKEIKSSIYKFFTGKRLGEDLMHH